MLTMKGQKRMKVMTYQGSGPAYRVAPTASCTLSSPGNSGVERTARDTGRPEHHENLTRNRAARKLNAGSALVLAATLALISGCDIEPRHPVDQYGCAKRCANDGMVAVGRIDVVNSSGCICAVDRPVACDTAWSRADMALSLLADCRSTLLQCTTKGGGL